MLYDFSGTGYDFGSLGSGVGTFGAADPVDGGSGFFDFANKGLDVLSSLGGGWLALQQQANKPQYYGQPEQTRDLGIVPDTNGGMTRGGDNSAVIWLVLGVVGAVALLKFAKD